MSDFYEVLIAELRDDPLGRGYARMTDAEVAAALNATTRTKVVQRFISLRAVANVLDDVEYGLLKQALAVAVQQSPRVADMVGFLEMPCDASGTTGGIDFGNETVRAFICQLCDSLNAGQTGKAIKQKLLALAEEPCSRLEELGLNELVNEHHVASARKMMEA